MTQIDPKHRLQIAQLADRPSLTPDEARRWLGRQDQASLPLLLEARLHSLRGYPAQREVLLEAAQEQARGNRELTARIRHLAQRFGHASHKPTGPRPSRDSQTTQQTRSSQKLTRARGSKLGRAAAASAAPGEGCSKRVSSRQQARQQLQQLLATRQTKGLATSFFQDRQANLQALGTLRPGDVAVSLGQPGRDPELGERLQQIAFQAFRDQVVDRLRERVTDTALVVATLGRSAEARRSMLAQQPSRAALIQELRGLGISPHLADQIARAKGDRDPLLVQGLGEAASGLEEVAQLAGRALVNDKATLQLFALCAPLVGRLQASAGIRPGSFAAEAITSGLARGRTQQRWDTVGKHASSLISNIIVGVISGGTSVVAQVVAPIAASCGSSAITGLPSLAQASARVRQARVAEGLGLAPQGATATAQGALRRAGGEYAASIAISGATSAAGVALSGAKATNAASSAITEESSARAAVGSALLSEALVSTSYLLP